MDVRELLNLKKELRFDENGKLKPAGIGGPEIGEPEDGIWNLLQQF